MWKVSARIISCGIGQGNVLLGYLHCSSGGCGRSGGSSCSGPFEYKHSMQ